VVAMPLDTGTRGFLSAERIALMKQTAVFVNISRGKVVDESALARALAEGRILGAGLDAFAREPLPADSPLWDLPNVLITPHTSGFRPDHWDVMTNLFAENLRRYDSDQPLLNVIDKRAGY
jgi:phosphoglycerate dehydrogenase-like enzyme